MAALIIACPACAKKFKGKEGLTGKRIKCPLCTTPFVVTAEHLQGAKAKADAPIKMQTDKPAGGSKARVTWNKEDENSEGYTLGKFDLRARCPNCANLMESEEAIVCVFCGYNTQTRTLGAAVKTTSVTGGQHFVHLIPGLSFLLMLIVFAVALLFFCLELPPLIVGTWAAFFDHESMRMWIIGIALGFMWAFGMLTVRRLVLNPKPAEIEKEKTSKDK